MGFSSRMALMLASLSLLLCLLSGETSWRSNSRASSLVAGADRDVSLDELNLLGDEGVTTVEKVGAVTGSEQIQQPRSGIAQLYVDFLTNIAPKSGLMFQDKALIDQTVWEDHISLLKEESSPASPDDDGSSIATKYLSGHLDPKQQYSVADGNNLSTKKQVKGNHRPEDSRFSRVDKASPEDHVFLLKEESSPSSSPKDDGSSIAIEYSPGNFDPKQQSSVADGNNLSREKQVKGNHRPEDSRFSSVDKSSPEDHVFLLKEESSTSSSPGDDGSSRATEYSPRHFDPKQQSSVADGNNLSKEKQVKGSPGLEDSSISRGEDDDGSSSSSTMILLLNGDVYTPTPIGKAHVLLAGKSIVAIFKDEVFPWANLLGLPVKIIDVNGSLVVPGFIDIHVHITGGGGEAGPASRTPEASLSELLNAGLTTVVGTLGTDCVSRSLENLRVKAAALKEEGLTAYMWSGCYRVPSPTLTGSLVRDLQLIEEVIGAGEIAISDHRGSWPNPDELMKMVSDARVGGMLSGKAGVVHFHTGAALSLLDPLWGVINMSRGAIPITQMIPTHISSRGQALLEAAETWIQAGGRVDFTSDQEGENASFTALRDWARKGNVALESVSLSSDGFGSLPFYDSQGKLLKYGIASPKANLHTVQQLVLKGGWTLQQALPLSTINPATFLSLPKKGRLEASMDGDVLVLDAQNLQIEYVIATGRLMKTPTWTKTGLFGK